MNAHQRTIAAAVLTAGLLLAGCKRGGRGQGMGGNLVPAKMMDLPAQVIATGAVAPQVGAEVPVGPRVSGTLKKLYVQIGDRVTKGQVLGVLDEKDLQANVDSAAASLEAAKATAVYTQSNYDRIKELLPKGYVAKDAVEVALQNRDSALANVRKAQAQLEYAKIQLSYATVKAPIDGIVESVATQEGSTVAASFNAPTFVTLIDLNRLEVDAYVDEVDIGGVKVGQKVTFTVDAYTDKVFHGVVAAIRPQAVIQDNVVNYAVIIRIEGVMQAAQEAEAALSGESRPEGDHPGAGPGRWGGRGGPGKGDGRGERGQGHKGEPPPAAKPKPATPPPGFSSSYEGLLRPQMTASVTINMDSTKGALVIPSKAVKHDGGKTFVMVPSGKGFTQRPVTLGRESGDSVQVKAGLSPGDKVLIAGSGRGSEGP